MKKTLLLLFLSFTICSIGQQISLKKGSIMDNIPVASDSISETFALYLPTSFDISKEWPVVFVFDMEGRGKQVLSMFREAADAQGYILAASNNVRDSLTISKNILTSSRMFNTVYSLLPVKKNRTYTAGFDAGARMASLVPTFIKEVKGVISCGSPVANEEVLSTKKKYHFIGIVGNQDFNYPAMSSGQKLLNKLKFQNQLMVFEGGQQWPASNYLDKALEVLTVTSMLNGTETKNDAFIDKAYDRSLGETSALVKEGKALMANALLEEMIGIYQNHRNVDSLRASLKTLKKTKLFKTSRRSQNNAFFKENFIRDDFTYYLEQDVLTYNYNNLGWWNYQMEELYKYEKETNVFERNMGRRLKSYLNALIADNIDLVKLGNPVDEEALNFLWMMNTITDVKNPMPYLKVISNSAKVEDYGTALFYLEELLKTGYSDKSELYSLEHTAILRISPEFNKIVAKYLKDARYEVIEE